MFSMCRFLRTYWPEPDRLVHFVRTYGVEPPSRPAVVKWFERESVPANWFATLLALLELDRGKPVSLIPFLEK